MYILCQENTRIIDSSYVTDFYIKSATSASWDGKLENHIEVRAFMTVSIGTEDSYIRTLEQYDDMKTAQKALRKLFCALRDGAEVFYMPQP